MHDRSRIESLAREPWLDFRTVAQIHGKPPFGIDADEDAGSGNVGRIVNHRPVFGCPQCRLEASYTGELLDKEILMADDDYLGENQIKADLCGANLSGLNLSGARRRVGRRRDRCRLRPIRAKVIAGIRGVLLIHRQND